AAPSGAPRATGAPPVRPPHLQAPPGTNDQGRPAPPPPPPDPTPARRAPARLPGGSQGGAPPRDRAGGGASHFQDLLFLGRQQVVDLLDVAISQFLHLGLRPAGLVLGRLPVLFQLLDGVVDIPPHVAHRDPLVLGLLAGKAGQLFAAFLRQRRQLDAQ